MYQILKKNWDKVKYLILSGFIVTFLLLLTVVYKSDEEIVKKSSRINDSYAVSDLKTLKEYLFKQIK